jgi:hypothetical protein
MSSIPSIFKDSAISSCFVFGLRYNEALNAHILGLVPRHLKRECG